MRKTKTIPVRGDRAHDKGFADGGDPSEKAQIPCFGKVMPDLHFELIADPANPGGLQLHVHKGSRFYTSSEVHVGCHVYFPAPIGAGLAQAVRFPPPNLSLNSCAISEKRREKMPIC